METNNAKVLRARLMDQPEDFKKLGINPAKVEKWEDGRRTKTEEVGSEIWYFDGTMEDGTKYMVGFRPKSPEGMAKFEDSPHVNIYIKSPDGKESLTAIWEKAFRYCRSLKEISIPPKVWHITDDVFDGCTSLRRVTIRSKVMKYERWIPEGSEVVRGV